MPEVFLTPADISNIKFRVRLLGYDKEEVDEWMLRIYHDYSTLYRENAQLREKLATLERELSRFKELEADIKDAVVIARETADRLVRAAEEEAKQRYQSKLLELEEVQRQLNQIITALRAQINALIALRDQIADELDISISKLMRDLSSMRSKWNDLDKRIELTLKQALPDPSYPERGLRALPPSTRSRRVKKLDEIGVRSDSKA